MFNQSVLCEVKSLPKWLHATLSPKFTQIQNFPEDIFASTLVGTDYQLYIFIIAAIKYGGNVGCLITVFFFFCCTQHLLECFRPYRTSVTPVFSYWDIARKICLRSDKIVSNCGRFSPPPAPPKMWLLLIFNICPSQLVLVKTIIQTIISQFNCLRLFWWE